MINIQKEEDFNTDYSPKAMQLKEKELMLMKSTYCAHETF